MYAQYKRITRKYLVKPVKSFIRYYFYFMLDIVDILLGRREKLIPPRRMTAIGVWDFRKTGEEFFRYFTEIAKLQSDAKILDVGCGLGRMAVPLTSYLNGNGSYEGFDIESRGIKWCRKNVTPLYPNFKFQHSDIFNLGYNPNGSVLAREYRFPYKEEAFDFVFLTSVFTHMLPADMENYLKEIARVLVKGGKCFITYFLLNPESLRLIAEGKSTQNFKYSREGYSTTHDSIPETAIAYDENTIRSGFIEKGLDLIGQIHYGNWCGRDDYLSYQDIVIAVKK